MATILIVDDCPSNRTLLVKLLGYRQHHLLEASDGLEALQLARAEHPDLIISDILMPTMDGYEFVRQLRADSVIGHTPVVFCTAHYLNREASALAKDCGVAFIIHKPCELETVLRTVDAALASLAAPTLPCEGVEFDREHLRLLTDKIAAQADELQTVNQKLAALLELGNRLASERDPRRLLDEYCGAARGIIGAQYAVVEILRDQGPTLGHVFSAGLDNPTAARLGSIAPYQGVLNTLLRENRPCRLGGLHGVPQAIDLPPDFPPLRSLLGVPISFQTRVYGWLCLLNKLGTETFREEDEGLAVTLASQMAVAYENARLYKSLALHAEMLEREVEERKRAEAEALRQATWFTQLFENAPVGIVMVDEHNRVLRVNKSFESIFQFSQDDIRGRPLDEVIVPPELNEEAHRLSHGTLCGAATARETRWQRQDGSLVPVQMYGVPIVVHGTQVGGCGMYVDLSERKHLEAQFLQAQKMDALGILAGGVAHDFNNLLTVISGHSELLLADFASNGPHAQHLEEIRRAGERAAALTHQLLAFSRQQVLQLKILDLNASVTDVDQMLRRLIGEDIELSIMLDPELGRVRADPGQIEQLLLNLAVNARDAMPEGGRLTITTANVRLDERAAHTQMIAHPGVYVQLSVSDTGCGMNAATQAHIFEPFFTTKESGKGTGLGLSTVYGIVQQSAGCIAVTSTPGQGTTFTISLPHTTGVAETPLQPPSSHLARGQETVLVVEDEPGVRRLAVETLRQHGYRVLEASHGEEALCLGQAQGKETIALLLTDVVMPHMSGDELAHRLRAVYPNIKILFVSGYIENAHMRQAILHQDTTFLPKPYTPTVLALKVREVLDQSSDTCDGGD